MIMKGTGRANSHPVTRSFFRPLRSANLPANKFTNALTRPKLTMKERIALLEAMPNSRSAMRGSTVRSNPTMPPTNALTTTSSENCPRFCVRPKTIELCFSTLVLNAYACLLARRTASISAGLGGEVLAIFSINEPRSSASVGFQRFSKARVDIGFPLIPAPQSEPEKCAG
jgi:hypothetical protein